MNSRPSEQGFVLVEALVAAAIIALMFAVTLQVVAQQARMGRLISQRRMATMVAQSQLAALGADPTTSFGNSHGDTNGIPWRINIERYLAGSPDGVRLDLVTISAGDDGSGRALVTLHTLKIAR